MNVVLHNYKPDHVDLGYTIERTILTPSKPKPLNHKFYTLTTPPTPPQADPLTSLSRNDYLIQLKNSLHLATEKYTPQFTPKRKPAVRTESSKKKRAFAHGYDECDVSMGTVQSVLRLVDESLMYTPERDEASTPTVVRSRPGPSPMHSAPLYAHSEMPKFRLG